MASVNPDFEILVTTRLRQANEWGKAGHTFVTCETVTDADRFPGDGQGWDLPKADRTGNHFTRRRVAYVFLRTALA